MPHSPCMIWTEMTSDDTEQLIASLQSKIAALHDDEKSALTSDLTALQALYARKSRQLDRLVKLSDANEAKLTKANNTLADFSQNLSRFVPKTVAEALNQTGSEAIAKTERRDVTVFFSDIVGFTTMTERMEPEQLASVMTDYFTEMTRICDKWGGTLDQFVGDAIIIFFGAPDSAGTEQDAVRAVSMALEMQSRLSVMQANWDAAGYTIPLRVRMGLSSGFCNVGNFGSDRRLHYTALGNTMNEAARIQDLCPPEQVLVSDDCYLRIRDHIACEKADEIQLRGRAHPTQLYLPIAKQDSEAKNIILGRETGFRLYVDKTHIKEKQNVITLLEAALQLVKED